MWSVFAIVFHSSWTSSCMTFSFLMIDIQLFDCSGVAERRLLWRVHLESIYRWNCMSALKGRAVTVWTFCRWDCCVPVPKWLGWMLCLLCARLPRSVLLCARLPRSCTALCQVAKILYCFVPGCQDPVLFCARLPRSCTALLPHSVASLERSESLLRAAWWRPQMRNRSSPSPWAWSSRRTTARETSPPVPRTRTFSSWRSTLRND